MLYVTPQGKNLGFIPYIYDGEHWSDYDFMGSLHHISLRRSLPDEGTLLQNNYTDFDILLSDGTVLLHTAEADLAPVFAFDRSVPEDLRLIHFTATDSVSTYFIPDTPERPHILKQFKYILVETDR